MPLRQLYVTNKKFVPVYRRTANTRQFIDQWPYLGGYAKIHFDCAAKLSSFNQPVLILQGKNDIIEV